MAKNKQNLDRKQNFSEGSLINFLKQVIINLKGKARLWFRESTLDVPAFVLQYLLIANANCRYLSNFRPSLVTMTLCAFSLFHEKFWMLQKVRRPRRALFPTSAPLGSVRDTCPRVQWPGEARAGRRGTVRGRVPWGARESAQASVREAGRPRSPNS